MYFYKASDKKVYYRPNNEIATGDFPDTEFTANDVLMGDAVVGDNFFYAVSDVKFESNIEYIGAVSINGSITKRFQGW